MKLYIEAFDSFFAFFYYLNCSLGKYTPSFYRVPSPSLYRVCRFRPLGFVHADANKNNFYKL